MKNIKPSGAAGLTTDEQELLRYILEDEEVESAPGQTILPREGRESVPLSYAQQRLWFLDQLQTGAPLYNAASAVRLLGKFDLEAFRRTLNEIVRRHEVLRTTFGVIDGRPVQIVAAPRPLELGEVDLGQAPESEREEAVRQLASAEARRPFDLSIGPLLRVSLLGLGEQERVAVLVMHHIVTDAWSMAVLFKEVGALYEAFAAGRPSPLDELPIQYADYAVWQREWLQGEVLEKRLAFWRGQLDGAPELLELPADRPRPAVQGFNGAAHRLLLPVPGRLKTFNTQEGVTMFMTLLAAFQVLLWRYTGQTDIVVGTPVAGRNRVQTEALIGFFINTLALRTDLSGDPTFRELIRRVKRMTLASFDNQDAPFEKLVEELHPARSQSHQPLFQVLFALQNAPRERLELNGLTLDKVDVWNGMSKFDLTLSIVETPRELIATAEYKTELFDAATVERLLGHYRRLLESLVAFPEARISQLSPLTEEEKHWLLHSWNETAEYPRDKCLNHLFEEQARRTPDGVALSFEAERLTYDELNRRANQLAQHLRTLGVGPDILAGVCFERSVEMVVSILGILKAGGAYLPLDPAYPKERLSFMLNDAQVEVVLTQQGVLGSLPEHVGRIVRVVRLDTDWEVIERESQDNLPGVNCPENLAYVIYTSGSTGEPKGVAVSHHNVARLFAAAAPLYDFNRHDVWTMFHSYAFDFSVWEMWGALLYGGRLAVVPYWVSRTPEAFARLLREEGVTVLNQTPSAFRQLLRSGWGAEADEARQVRVVIFGGEALEAGALAGWVDLHGDATTRLVNMYGITETCVHVTYCRLLAGDAREPRGSVIGAALADAQVYVLDQYMQPAPLGVAGELYVGGAGVARGYLNRPALTAERFVPDPFRWKPGGRLYRSGDLARRRPDGDIEWLGRADEQVKVRGFRIELGEIEAMLGRHEAVKEAVVLIKPGETDDPCLVAYVVCDGDARATPTASDLRRHLEEKLPDYLVPASFALLERLPLTPNGKVDRRALPDPGASRLELESAYTHPSNEVEEALAAIWAGALNLERVGVHDNFFELGGDSIRSVRLLATAKEVGLDFTLQQLFRCQTVHELAKEMKTNGGAAPRAAREPFGMVGAKDRLKLPSGLEDAYPLATLQSGMLYHMAYMPEQMVYHNVYSYHLKARFGLEAFRESLRRVTERHAILRTSFDLETYSESLQLVHRTIPVALEADDLRSLSFEEQESALVAFVESEKLRRFDITRPPLLRFRLHQRTDETFNLTFTECHPILDGWSLHSLLAEIFSAYFALLDDGEAPKQPPLASSFRDFVSLERAALESEEAKRFWNDKLADYVVSELPRRQISPPGQDGPRIRRLNFPLPTEMSEGLARLARTLGVPLKSVLLAAHVKAMSIACGETDVLTGLLSTGRPEEADAENVLGLFFNTLAFRLKVRGGTWEDLIKTTFKAELELLPFRRYPLAALQRQRGRKPLFETVFNYLHFHVLDDLFKSGELEFLGVTDYWEETNLTLSTVFRRLTLSPEMLLTLRYDSTQFSEEQVNSIGGYYLNILDSMPGEASARHDFQAFLSPRERHQLLFEWGWGNKDGVEARCIHHLFEEQAEKLPEALAVVFENEQLTYAQLNARANQLAHHLRSLGVGPEEAVGVLLERSADALVAMLGVLKAGGAYAPLDPAYPRKRLASLFEESGARVLLARRGSVEWIAEGSARVLGLDAEREAISRHSAQTPSSGVTSGNMVYMFFTSGSTGRPKAVAVEHRQLFNYTKGVTEKLELPSGASFAMVSTFATDLGNTAIFPALCTGGCLHVISTERASDPEALAAYFDHHSIDCLKIVPAHLNALLAASPTSRILPRRRLILGGEALRWELVETLRWLAPECAVYNHYGPTETTVGVLAYRVEQESGAYRASATVPLGRPFAGAEIYLLDDDLNLAPPGVHGEIYIGGANLARGYFGQPAQTTERFVPHPFSREPGARLYRTGDSARYLPSGDLEFLGRRDHQSKIRGYRVEPGEIERALAQHQAVKAVVVVAHEDTPGEPRLVAYLAPVQGASPDPGEFRNYARSILPDYMTPSKFVLLDALPLTPGGKIDRRSLPVPDRLGSEPESAYVAPSGEVESLIAALWQEALQVEKVSVDESFFDLGGHSLILLRVQSKLCGAFERNISIVELFEHPTVRMLARHLARGRDAAAPSFLEMREQAEARRGTLETRKRRNQRQPARDNR